MADGRGTRNNASELGSPIKPGFRVALTNEDTLTAQERADWFRFRATGKALNSFAGRVSHLGSVEGDSGDDSATSGFTGTSRLTLFFQRQGTKELRRLGALRGSIDRGTGTPLGVGETAFLLPKGPGTYYVKISRVNRAAFSGNIEYSFSFSFFKSNLSTSDQPDGRPFFF